MTERFGQKFPFAIFFVVCFLSVPNASAVGPSEKNPPAKVLQLAERALRCAVEQGKSADDPYLALVDYSLPSTDRRFWLVDRKTGKVLISELVAHGKNTGENWAKKFSNRPESLESSLGLYRAGTTYTGGNGYTLVLHGLEPGFNDRALERKIVLHGADYVSPDFIKQHGRLGRSWGCPAVPAKDARRIIDLMSEKAYLFIYYPEREWLNKSPLLNGCGT